MTFTKVLFPSLLALTTQVYPTVSASADPKMPLEEVYIKNFTASGTGCTAGSFEKNLSEDKRAFTMTYSRFVAEISPWTAPSEARKNCSITLTLNIPAGFQYTVGTFNYRGFMELAPKVKADFKTIYFFEGVGETGNFTKTEFGPLAKDFVYTDTVGVTSAYIPETWSPCATERALIINPTISLTRLQGAAADVQSIITNDSTDGEIVQEFGLAYRRCGETTPPNPNPNPTPTPTPTPTPSPTPPKGLVVGSIYNLVSRHSGQCLDVKDHALANGAKLQQWNCTGEDHQKFRLVDQGSGNYGLVGLQSGKILSVENSWIDNGNGVIQWDNFSSDNQKLIISPSNIGAYTVRFRHSNKCMDIDGPSFAPGTRIHQWDCMNAPSQDWFFVPARGPLQPYVEYTLVSRYSGKCLDVFDHATFAGARLQQWTCTGEPHQKFRLVDFGAGNYSLVGVQSGKTLTVADSSQNNGAQVLQWDDQWSANQRVILSPSADGSWALRFNHSSKCLDVDGPSFNDGAKVQQWECQGVANQDWFLRR